MFPTTFDSEIKAAAERWLPYDWRLYKAQLWQESRFIPTAKSGAGAMGVAQFMPDTWGDMLSSPQLALPPDASPYDPQWAIPAGAFYMCKLYNGWTAPRPEADRICLALASYNAGFGNILKAQKHAKGASDYASIIHSLPLVTGDHAEETTEYVERILGYYKQMVTE